MKQVIAALTTVLLTGTVDVASFATDGADPRVRAVATAEIPRPNGSTVVHPSGVYYSHYSANGNDSDIVKLDPDTGSLDTLVPAVRNARFVALDERYVLYLASQGLPSRLYLRDRRTGVEARSIRLRDQILWGRIDDDHILVLQSHEALMFSIPELKLVRTIPIGAFGRMPPGGPEKIQPWGHNIVVVAERLVVLDSNATVLAHYPLPRPPPRNNSSCSVFYLRVAGSSAFLGMSCGIIRAIDLNTGATRYEIDVGGIGPQLAVLNGILYIADRPESATRRLQFFDAVTGQRLGRTLGAAELLVAGTRRLAITQLSDEYRKPMKLTLFEPDVDAIRDPAAREARVLDGCAERRPTRDDLYHAIDNCEAADVGAYIEALGVEPLNSRLKEVLEEHAVRLAQTFSRYDESAPLLERLGLAGQHETLRLGVERKTELIERPLNEPSADPLPPGVRPVELYSSTLARTHFIGPHLYVAWWPCDGDTGAVMLSVFDRASLRRLGQVPVIACDSNYQDSISSVDIVGDHIVVGLESRYDDPRPNVGVIRLSDLSLMGVAHVEGGAPSLVSWRDRLVRCADGQELDPTTVALKSAPEAVQGACSDDAAGESLGGQAEKERGEWWRTRSFSISRGRTMRGINQYDVRRLSGEGEVFSFESASWSILAAPDSDTVVIHEPYNDAMRLVSVNLGTRERETVIELGISSTWGPFARWGHFVFIARGRDLMTFDLEQQVVVGYEKNVIRGGLQPVCASCNDGNGIRGFVLDGDRLFATTLRGATSLAIELPEYTRSLSSDDLFPVD